MTQHTIPAQMAARSASELAAIVRTTDNTHLFQAAVRELEVRLERAESCEPDTQDATR